MPGGELAHCTATLELMRCGILVIAVDDAFLHHEEDVLGLADILQWVTWNGDDIGEFTGFQRADFVCQAEEIGIGRSSRPERINGLHTQVNHLVELFGITPMRINGGVSAQPNFDAFDQRALEGGMRGVDRGMGFGGDGRRDIKTTVKLFLQALNGH